MDEGEPYNYKSVEMTLFIVKGDKKMQPQHAARASVIFPNTEYQRVLDSPSTVTSFCRELKHQKEPLDLRVVEKCKANDERPITPVLSEKRCKLATPENQVSGRQSPQPSRSGQASLPSELHYPAGFYSQNLQTFAEQLQKLQSSLVDKANSKQKHQQLTNMQQKPNSEFIYLGRGKGYQCSSCDHKSLKKWNIEIHSRVHSNIRPFQCTTCDKSFKRNDHLKDHFQSKHTDIKPFKCKLCDYTVSHSSAIKTHFIKRHPNESQEGRLWVKIPQPDSTSKALQYAGGIKKVSDNIADTLTYK